MNYKNKSVIISILILILVLGFWYFSSVIKNTRSEVPQFGQLTDQQRLDLLSKSSVVPTIVVSDTEKQKILSRVDTSVKSTSSSLSEEEKLQILNKTN